MAAATTRNKNSGISWISDDEEQPLVFVPVVGGEARTPFNIGPGSSSTSSKRDYKMPTRDGSNGKKETTLKKQGLSKSEHSGVHAKDEVLVRHSSAAATKHSMFPASGTLHPSNQVICTETSRPKNLIYLKDLCPEDKRRIANLVGELARVSEEKEESEQRLKDEHENFERKIQHLEQQNLVIAQERESLQQQYRECQELLGLYQQYLSQQQAKLNQSIAQLSQEPATNKVLSSEEVPSSTSSTCSLFDGSYLGLAATRSQQPQVHRRCGGGRAATQPCGNPASLSYVSEFSPTTRLIRGQKRECREPHSKSHHRCLHCQGCCQDSGYGTQQYRCDTYSSLENGSKKIFNQHEFERISTGNAIGSEGKEAMTMPLLGHEDWEEKKHQLLLQKMQLEAEREKLQARLAEQEERLIRQNQQLHQSRLAYSRFQQAAKSDFSSSKCTNGEPQLEGPSHQQLPTSVPEDAEGQSFLERQLQNVLPPLDNGNEALERSRKDMATSPAKSPTSLSKPTTVSGIQKTPEARLDFSVVELLDIFTPVSAPELSKPSTRRLKTAQLKTPKPVGRSPLTPARSHPQQTQQDQEESQILEDIFFIC